MSQDDKLDKLLSSMNQIHNKLDVLNSALMDEDLGIEPKLTATSTMAKETADRVQELEEENSMLRAEMDILRGLAGKHDEEIVAIKEKLDVLLMKSMEQNVVIGGILGESSQESVPNKVLKFLNQTLGIGADQDEIQTTYRIGQDNGRDRKILLKATPALKKRIFENTKNLKDKKTEQGRFYTVTSSCLMHTRSRDGRSGTGLKS